MATAGLAMASSPPRRRSPAEAVTRALTTAGTIRCWGWNGCSQLGSGNNANALQPVDVAALTNWWKVHVPVSFHDAVP
jgi:hypothetical protein